MSDFGINVTSKGIWLLADDDEYFLPYTAFSWIKDTKISDIYNITMVDGTHLYWPTIDVRLDLEALDSYKYPPLNPYEESSCCII